MMALRGLCSSLLPCLSSRSAVQFPKTASWSRWESWWGSCSLAHGESLPLHSPQQQSIRWKRARSVAPGPRQNQPRRHWITPELPAGLEAREQLSAENRAFLQQVVQDTYPAAAAAVSPLRTPPPERAPYTFKTRRCGLLCRKIGVMPQWTKTGKKILTTLLQVVDNHVISMSPSSQFGTTHRGQHYKAARKGLSSLVVGAESIDPTNLTDDYCRLFEASGLQPKRKLSKMIVSDHAVIPVGTPLRATHFRVGDYVDIGGRTVDHGFQGVMKRWNMRGGPASHGATKSHRRIGSIGFRRHNGRIMKGKRMPGHMGNTYRVHKGVQILRINTRHDVLWVRGRAIPGATNSWCMVWDTHVLPKRRLNLQTPPPMPTHYPEEDAQPLPEELVHPDLHVWDAPTIVFQVTEDDLKQKVRTGAKTALKAKAAAPAAAAAKAKK